MTQKTAPPKRRDGRGLDAHRDERARYGRVGLRGYFVLVLKRGHHHFGHGGI